MTPTPDDAAMPDEVRELHKRMDAAERPLVKELGGKIGYGRMMQLAEQIWHEITPGAEHTTGPCGAFMVSCHHPFKDENGHCDVCCGSGRITKWVRDNLCRADKPHAEAVRVLYAALKRFTDEIPTGWDDDQHPFPDEIIQAYKAQEHPAVVAAMEGK